MRAQSLRPIFLLCLVIHLCSQGSPEVKVSIETKANILAGSVVGKVARQTGMPIFLDTKYPAWIQLPLIIDDKPIEEAMAILAEALESTYNLAIFGNDAKNDRQGKVSWTKAQISGVESIIFIMDLEWEDDGP